MDLHAYLGQENGKHEAARIADGMRFFVELTKEADAKAPGPSAGGEFKTSANLSTPIPKQEVKAKDWSRAGKPAGITTRAPTIKKASLDKEAFLHHVPAMMGSAGKAIGVGADGIAAGFKRDAVQLKQQAQGYRQGLIGDRQLDSFGEVVNPSFIDKLKGRFGGNAGSERLDLLDPLRGNGALERFKTRLQPDTTGLGGAPSPYASVDERVNEAMGSARHLSPEKKLRLLILQEANKPGGGNSEYTRALRNRLVGFGRGRDVNAGVGTAGLYDHLYTSFTNADGSMSPLSVFEGAHKTGLLQAKATKDAASAGWNRITGNTDEAAQAAKMKRYALMGGVAGGGVLAGGLAMRGMNNNNAPSQ
jgi:hypothetical protein